MGGNWVHVGIAVGVIEGVNVGAFVLVMLGVTLGKATHVLVGVGVPDAVAVGALVLVWVGVVDGAIAVTVLVAVMAGVVEVTPSVSVIVTEVAVAVLGNGVAKGVAVIAGSSVLAAASLGVLLVGQKGAPSARFSHTTAPLTANNTPKPIHFQPSVRIFWRMRK